MEVRKIISHTTQINGNTQDPTPISVNKWKMFFTNQLQKNRGELER